MRRVIRALMVGLFVLVMAVTPLSATTSGGIHEAWIRSEYGSDPIRVVLKDLTGLVRGVAAFTPDRQYPPLVNGDDDRTLVLNWFDYCPVYRLDVTFASAGDRYKLNLAAHSVSCSWFDRNAFGTITIMLSHPVDAATVAVWPPPAP